ncbi:MAG: 6-phosphogluconolactonase [Rhodobacteraceae bacterium]|nr:6-phosphogluconolactonase [Paracoccaceae bacterium]
MNLITYKNTSYWGQSVAILIHSQLEYLISKKGKASLVVPGGTTPDPVFNALSNMELDWSKVIIIPSDERCVTLDSKRSNERMIRNSLLKNKAEGARLISLFQDQSSGEETNKQIRLLLPLSICLLGMGEDLHVASLFPDSDELSDAIAKDAPETVCVSVPSQPEQRITLSLNVLNSAQHTHLLFKGETKLKVFMQRGHDHNNPLAPVSFFTRQATVHYIE